MKGRGFRIATTTVPKEFSEKLVAAAMPTKLKSAAPFAQPENVTAAQYQRKASSMQLTLNMLRMNIQVLKRARGGQKQLFKRPI